MHSQASNQLNYTTGYILLSETIKENMGVEPASHDKGIQYTFAAQLTALLKILQTLMHNTYAHRQILKEPSL